MNSACHISKNGHAAVIIGIFQACFITLVVAAVLFGIHLIIPGALSLADVLILGAIAAATAPAATLMVVRQYKAKGPLTSTLLPVVALDDAVGLVLFAASYGIAMSLKAGASADFMTFMAGPFLEISCSLRIGEILGWLLTHTARIFHSNRNRISLITTFIIFGVTISTIGFHLFGFEFS